MKKKVEVAEVMKKGAEAQISLKGKFEALPEISERLKEECDQYGMLEQEARWRALRIGLLCLKAKPLLKHGEFLPWLETHCGHRKSHAYRCMQLAEVCLRQTKLDPDAIFTASAPKQLEAAKTSKVLNLETQTLFDFMGEDGLYDLFKKYHVSTGLPTGGYHPRDPKASGNEENMEELCAVVDWKKLSEQLFKHGLDKKTWVFLPNEKKIEVYGLIDAVRGAMKDAVSVLKQSKRG